MDKFSKVSDNLVKLLTSEETFTIITSVCTIITATKMLVAKLKGGNNNGNPKV